MNYALENRQQSLNGDIPDIVSLFATLGSSYSPLLNISDMLPKHSCQAEQRRE